MVHTGIFWVVIPVPHWGRKQCHCDYRTLQNECCNHFQYFKNIFLHKDMNVRLLLKTQEMRRDCTIPSWPQWSEAELLLTGVFYQVRGLVLVTCLQHLGLWSLLGLIWPVSFYSWGNKNDQAGQWWWWDENLDFLNSGLTFVFIVHISMSQTGDWGLYLTDIWEIPYYTQLPV